MTINRRAMLHGLFGGASLLGLRSLATGLPISLLMRPLEARAEYEEAACTNKEAAQYLILSTSLQGDPLNANVPGTYEFPEIVHPPDPRMAKTALSLAGKPTTAAKPWADLPQDVLDRTAFFHHTTLTNGHGGERKVLELMGGTQRNEMFVSIFSKYLAGCLGTVQKQPISLAAQNGSEYLFYEGRALPPLTPNGLRATLLNEPGPLTDLQNMRDKQLDRLNALYKAQGTATQRAFLDRIAKSQAEVRGISQELLDNLAAIDGNDKDDQIVAAAVLIRMNVTPVLSMRISFGADNHFDEGLEDEASSTVSGVAAIGRLQAKLAEMGLKDKVTFAMMNVFGRTLSVRGLSGRDHLGNHHVTVMIGSRVKGGIIGGLAPNEGGADFKALPIDSTTGAGTKSGDIPFEETLGAVGKTLGAAVGVPASVLDEKIFKGKIVPAALV
jgi:hypothetical protein